MLPWISTRSSDRDVSATTPCRIAKTSANLFALPVTKLSEGGGIGVLGGGGGGLGGAGSKSGWLERGMCVFLSLLRETEREREREREDIYNGG